jgi:hypothetical protein
MASVSASVLLAYMICPAATKAPIDMKWKFTEGDVLFITATQDTESTAFDKGKTVQKLFAMTVIKYKLVVSADAETEIRLTQLSISSGEADTREKLKTVLQKSSLDGQSFTFGLKPDGKVFKIRGNQALWNAAPTFAPEQTVEPLATVLFRTVPGKAMRLGERWDVESGYPIPGGGFMEVKARCYADSVADGVVKVVAEVDHSWDSRGAKTDSSFDELHGKDGVREAWFDLKSGRVRKVEESRTMNGLMRPPSQNVVVTHRQKQTIEVSDTPPKEE